MIEIKPDIRHQSICPYCKSSLRPQSVLWQGIHVCIVATCPHCKAEIVEDIRVGHALYYPSQVDVNANKIFLSNQEGLSWFGAPLLRSLMKPEGNVKINLNIEKMQDKKDVIILNCIDYLYGHSVLKLLNIEAHLNKNPDLGLVVIIPSFLKWMVPRGVAEIWTVDIPLSKAQNYFPMFNEQIQKECLRFRKIYVSRAHSHPKDFDITNFTGTPKYDSKQHNSKTRITFIWREDRLWHKKSSPNSITKIFLLRWQNIKVRRLFSLLRGKYPQAVFTVTGLGTSSSFPEWIDDQRISKFNMDVERRVCELYSDSLIVIGVHGSNMLLPSAHAGMSMDLMPDERWGNFAQDILYQEADSRIASYKYRFLPLTISVKKLALIISNQLSWYSYFKMQMQDEFKDEFFE